MSWSERISVGLIFLALVQAFISLRVWVGVSARQWAGALALSGIAVVLELALWGGKPYPLLPDWMTPVIVHCAAAALLLLVVVDRAVHYRRHLRELEHDLELLERAIELQKTAARAEESSQP